MYTYYARRITKDKPRKAVGKRGAALRDEGYYTIETETLLDEQQFETLKDIEKYLKKNNISYHKRKPLLNRLGKRFWI